MHTLQVVKKTYINRSRRHTKETGTHTHICIIYRYTHTYMHHIQVIEKTYINQVHKHTYASFTGDREDIGAWVHVAQLLEMHLSNFPLFTMANSEQRQIFHWWPENVLQPFHLKTGPFFKVKQTYARSETISFPNLHESH